MKKQIMKKLLLILVLGIGLSSCDRIVDLVRDKFELVATQQQNQKAEQLYQALLTRDTPRVKSLVANALQKELQASPEVIEDVYKLLPSEVASSMEITEISKSMNSSDGKFTVVTYQYHYPNMTIEFNVAFQGYDGDSNIIGFHINQWMSENKKGFI